MFICAYAIMNLVVQWQVNDEINKIDKINKRKHIFFGM